MRRSIDNTTPHWYEIPMEIGEGNRAVAIQLTDGGVGDDDLIVDAGAPGISKEVLQTSIQLHTGWNLISSPLNLNTWELGEEVAVGDPSSVTPENSLTSIYRYNTTSELFEKCTHYAGWGWAPATGSESFTELEPGRGYWAMADNDCLWNHET